MKMDSQLKMLGRAAMGWLSTSIFSLVELRKGRLGREGLPGP